MERDLLCRARVFTEMIRFTLLSKSVSEIVSVNSDKFASRSIFRTNVTGQNCSRPKFRLPFNLVRLPKVAFLYELVQLHGIDRRSDCKFCLV